MPVPVSEFEVRTRVTIDTKYKEEGTMGYLVCNTIIRILIADTWCILELIIYTHHWFTKV